MCWVGDLWTESHALLLVLGSLWVWRQCYQLCTISYKLDWIFTINWRPTKIKYSQSWLHLCSAKLSTCVLPEYYTKQVRRDVFWVVKIIALIKKHKTEKFCRRKMNGVKVFLLSATTTSLFIFIIDMCRPPDMYSHNWNGTKLKGELLIEDVEVKNQFITHGRWRPGKKHDQRCEFIETTKCCKQEQNQHFEFFNKKLNSINAVKEFKRKLRNKKLLLMGDSLMMEFFEYLVVFLHMRDPSEKYRFKAASKSTKSTGIRQLNIPRINSKVTLLPAHLISLKGQKKFTKLGIYMPTAEKTVWKEISRHDVIFINQGIHYGGVTLLGETTIHFNNVGKMLYGKFISCGSLKSTLLFTLPRTVTPCIR